MNALALASTITVAVSGPWLSPPAAAQDFPVHPSTQRPEVRTTLADLQRWETELSNWGRWGPDGSCPDRS